MTELELLRTRLVSLCCNALERLAGADRLDAGLLELVAHAGAALVAAGLLVLTVMATDVMLPSR